MYQQPLGTPTLENVQAPAPNMQAHPDWMADLLRMNEETAAMNRNLEPSYPTVDMAGNSPVAGLGDLTSPAPSSSSDNVFVFGGQGDQSANAANLFGTLGVPPLASPTVTTPPLTPIASSFLSNDMSFASLIPNTNTPPPNPQPHTVTAYLTSAAPQTAFLPQAVPGVRPVAAGVSPPIAAGPSRRGPGSQRRSSQRGATSSNVLRQGMVGVPMGVPNASNMMSAYQWVQHGPATHMMHNFRMPVATAMAMQTSQQPLVINPTMTAMNPPSVHVSHPPISHPPMPRSRQNSMHTRNMNPMHQHQQAAVHVQMQPTARSHHHHQQQHQQQQQQIRVLPAPPVTISSHIIPGTIPSTLAGLNGAAAPRAGVHTPLAADLAARQNQIALAQHEAKVLQGNKVRLQQLREQMVNAGQFVTNCRELAKWCDDRRAYVADLAVDLLDTFKAVFDGALTFGCFAALPLFMIVVRYAEIYMRAPFKECILLWLKVLTKHGARSGPTTLQPGHTSQISDYYLKKRHQLSEALQAARAQQQQTGRPTSVGPLDITPEPITQRDNTAVSITPTVRPLPEGHTPWLVDTLVSPVTISRPEKGANTKVVFVLSEARFQALRDAAATTITTAITHPFRVRLNMYKPTDLAKRTEWPLPMSHIEVNGSKLLLERKMIRRSRDGAIVVGKNRASDISEFLRCGPNVLWVSFGEGPDSGREWCLEVEFLRYLEVEGVRECVLGTRLDRGFTEGRVKAMLQSGDEDVVQESVPIDLRCALTYTRVKTPVRGTGCTHLECFDLDNFLEAARGVEIPGCPVCGRRVTADAVCVDEWFVEILGRVPVGVLRIAVEGDGRWRVVELDEEEEEEGGEGTPMGGGEVVKSGEDVRMEDVGYVSGAPADVNGSMAHPVVGEGDGEEAGRNSTAGSSGQGMGSEEQPYILIDDDEDEVAPEPTTPAGGQLNSADLVSPDAMHHEEDPEPPQTPLPQDHIMIDGDEAEEVEVDMPTTANPVANGTVNIGEERALSNAGQVADILSAKRRSSAPAAEEEQPAPSVTQHIPSPATLSHGRPTASPSPLPLRALQRPQLSLRLAFPDDFAARDGMRRRNDASPLSNGRRNTSGSMIPTREERASPSPMDIE